MSRNRPQPSMPVSTSAPPIRPSAIIPEHLYLGRTVQPDRYRFAPIHNPESFTVLIPGRGIAGGSDLQFTIGIGTPADDRGHHRFAIVMPVWWSVAERVGEPLAAAECGWQQTRLTGEPLAQMRAMIRRAPALAYAGRRGRWRIVVSFPTLTIEAWSVLRLQLIDLRPCRVPVCPTCNQY